MILNKSFSSLSYHVPKKQVDIPKITVECLEKYPGEQISDLSD